MEGISDLRDESDRDGMRIFIEVKRDANPHKVLNNLFKHTALQTTFNLNMLALVDGQPQTLPLKSVIGHYVEHRREIVRRRTEFDLEKARARAHILEGLKIALDNLDEVIRTIRESADVERARAQPHEPLRPVRAAGPGDPRHAPRPPRRARAPEDRGRVPRRHPAHRRARGHPGQPGPRPRRSSRTSWPSCKRKYAGERRTRVVDDSNREMTDEDLIADEDVVVTISRRGYIKRQPVATYRRQHRGGKGIIGHVTREEDAVEHLLVGQHPRLGAVLHQPRPGVLGQGPRHPGRVTPGQGHGDHQPARGPGGVGRGPGRDDLPARTSSPATTSCSRPGAASSRRRRSSSSSACARPGSARSPSATATSWPGCRSRPAATTSSSPRRRACSPASARTRCGRWAATRPA